MQQFFPLISNRGAPHALDIGERLCYSSAMAIYHKKRGESPVHVLTDQPAFTVQTVCGRGRHWLAFAVFCLLIGGLPFGCAHNERPLRIPPLETHWRGDLEEFEEPVEEPEPQFTEGYILPLIHPAPRVSSTFGSSRRGGRVHKGVDLEVPAGTPVVAARCGEVRFSGWHGAYGNIIVVCHGDGYETAYAHLKENQAREGESVHQGQQIGLVGRTGNATANHLHFEIRRDGEPVDPRPRLLLAAE